MKVRGRTHVEEDEIKASGSASDVQLRSTDIGNDVLPLRCLDIYPVDHGVELLDDGRDGAKRHEETHQHNICEAC